MWREARSPRAVAAAAWRLLRLELRLMTGGSAWILGAAQVGWLVLQAILQRFRDEPLDAADFYVAMIVMPAMVGSVALGMSCVLAERDEGHLEMSFASPGGRYLLWCFRLAALVAASAASCLVLSVGAWIATGWELSPLTAAAHALVPVVMAGFVACFLALLFNGTAFAGLATGTLLFVSFVLLHGGGAGRFDPFVNPFMPPDGLPDPATWTRTLVFNRLALLSVTGACLYGTLALLQRRERLL